MNIFVVLDGSCKTTFQKCSLKKKVLICLTTDPLDCLEIWQCVHHVAEETQVFIPGLQWTLREPTATFSCGALLTNP